jgi:hypothetical protein
MTLTLKILQLQNEYKRTGNEELKTQADMLNQQLERQQAQEKLGLEGRSTFSKVFGGKPEGVPTQQASKQLNGENYIQIGGKWYKQ